MQPSPPGGERPGPAAVLPTITTPTGGGAIRGVGETFTANPATGSGTANLPLGLSEGRSGATPQVGLSYDSGRGNGIFGYGWSLPLPAISRRTDRGVPRYDDSDTFLLADAEDLVPVLDGDHDWAPARPRYQGTGAARYAIEQFRPRVAATPVRIERWTATDGTSHWRSISRDNVTTLYGATAASRIADPADPTRILTWLISETRDDRGNAIAYTYQREDESGVDLSQPHELGRDAAARTAGRHLKRIRYGNRTPAVPGEDLQARTDWMFEVVLDYGDHGRASPRPTPDRAWDVRADPFSSYRSGFEVRTYRLCRRVLMFHHFPDEPGVGSDCLVRATELDYRADGQGSFLTAATRAGFERDDATYRRRPLPPVEYEYTRLELDGTLRATDLPYGVDGRTCRWVDLDGEGLPGVLAEQAGDWYYQRNESTPATAAFGPARPVGQRPAYADLGAGRQQLADLAGDGRLDLLVLGEGQDGFAERDGDGWTALTPFTSAPVLAWNDPNLRFADLTGDGLADVLVTGDDAHRWYPSLGEQGFAAAQLAVTGRDEDDGPRVVFADGTQTVQLADLSGDGLVDLVRVRHDGISYWPNLGYGRFGRRIRMGSAPDLGPPELFDAGRVRFADVAGSGPADLIYLGPNGVTVWLNQSGNAWAPPHRLDLPVPDDVTGVQAVDLLGTGTAGLAWSSPLPGDAGRPVRYADLLGGVKPHLLTEVRNNLGARVRIRYSTSTRFFLEARAAGTPWLSTIPFPVHVVEQVITEDLVSRTTVVSRYAYHHPYFDGEDREFRGFALVEQWDTEEVEGPPATRVRTWFHTGAPDGGIEALLRAGHYGDVDLPDTVYPTDIRMPGGARRPYTLDEGERREAARALKGSLLRREVYADDGTEAASRPYSVTEANHTVELLQPRAGNRHAVVLVHPRESIDLHYERALYDVTGERRPDPRIAHTLVLAADEHGNVLDSVSAQYGRRYDDPDPLLTDDDRARQRAAQITWTSSTYTAPVDEPDVFRAPMVREARTWELAGVAPAPGRPLSFGALGTTIGTLAGGAHDREYEDADPSGPARRLIEHIRTVYRRDDLTGPLPPGDLGVRALPFDSYRLAFRGTMVADTYGSLPDPAATLTAAGYVAGDDEGEWWVPSGRTYYGTGTAAEELAEAEAHFFLVRRHTDALGAAMAVGYDAYDLLVEQTEDAVGNIVTATHDYRVLQPHTVADANGNATHLRHDELGMLVATAIAGKPGDATGDSLDADGPDGVGTATSRLAYDLFAFQRSQDDAQPQPAAVHRYAREKHTAQLAPGETVRVTHSIAYSDGFGREIQRKVPAEPAADGTARWVGTGWTVYDEKSRPVRKYEPFFSATPEFEFAATAGVSSILRYDPIGRLVATVRPDHTYEKVVFSPWRRARWDGNDTVDRADPASDPDVGAAIATLDPADYRPTWLTRMRQSADPADQAAAEAAVAHANTPSVVVFDAAGREFLAIVHNRLPRDGAVLDERYRTRTVHDVEGNLRSVADAADRAVSESRYDMLARLIRQDSADQGRRTLLPDARDAVVSRWDGFGRRHDTAYDPVGRPIALRVDGTLVEETTYGEGVPGAADANLRGRVARVRDQAGEVTTEAYDRRGAMIRSTRRLTARPTDRPDWSGAVGLAGAYTFACAYDALGRTLVETSPDGSVIRTEYNEAGLLERLTGTIGGTDARFVDGAAYDAHGRLTEFRYANGVVLTRGYDPRTGRLRTATTTRGADVLQDLRYTYDPVGNIIRIRDSARSALFFANQVVPAGAGYVYDATYQLIEATGRSLLGLRPGGEVRPAPHPADGAATARYVERYAYDWIGNLTEIRHTDTDPAGTTAVTTLPYGPDGRLAGGYGYDAHGNLTAMPQLPVLGWDEHDRLAASTRQRTGAGATPETTHYRYDAAGHRVRKATERYAPAGGEPTLATERIYLGALEIYREYDGTGRTVTLERLTVHVGAGGQRIAMAERRTAGTGPAPARQTRFPIGDHLGSTCLELDGEPGARIISYTEYLPYGGTATAAVAGQTETSPRYGWTGRERDEETGLSYQGARYYAAWLGRWLNPDPAGITADTNVYRYCLSNPVRYADPGGTDTLDKVGGYYVAFFDSVLDMKTDLWLKRDDFKTAYKAGRDMFDWYRYPSVRAARKDVVGNQYSANIAAGTLGLMSGFVPGAPDGSDLPANMQETYRMFRFASNGANTVMGMGSMLTTPPSGPPSFPMSSPAPAVALVAPAVEVNVPATALAVVAAGNSGGSSSTSGKEWKEKWNKEEEKGAEHREKENGKDTVDREIEVWIEKDPKTLEKAEGIRIDAANRSTRLLEEWTTPNQIAKTAPGAGKWDQMIRRMGLWQQARDNGWRLHGWSQTSGRYIGDITDWQHLTTKYPHWNWPTNPTTPPVLPPPQTPPVTP